MSQSAAELYEMVNSFMRLFGEPEFTPEAGEETGDESAQIRSLIAAYTARLRAKAPKYAKLPDELLPDGILIHLRSALAQWDVKAPDVTG